MRFFYFVKVNTRLAFSWNFNLTRLFTQNVVQIIHIHSSSARHTVQVLTENSRNYQTITHDTAFDIAFVRLL